ncbi:hypothetical protein DFH07DRAFT_784461 [Mycena maculata]|uniref:Uncharacterized protein n=1 Tax=Mycena maculata TaxID=230809 RepID=A0AAD7MK84_9AGAR|nr:hypothetical protein DFH07DRAFT_784461 [Mycena maculata]
MDGFWKKFKWYEGLDPADPVGSLKGRRNNKGAPDDEASTESPRAESLSLLSPTGSPMASPRASPQPLGDASDASTSNAPDAPDASASNAPDASDTPNPSGEKPKEDGGEEHDDDVEDTQGVDPKWKGEVQAIITAVDFPVSERRSKNPFSNWLKGFQRPPAPPHKLPLPKFYMQQEQYAAKINARFKTTWEDQNLEEKYQLHWRCQCAEALLAEESADLKKKLESLRDAEYDTAVKTHKKHVVMIEDPEELDDEGRAECRKNIAQVVQPFLDGMSKLTGYHVTLIAGAGPPEGSANFSLTTLHAGRSYVPGIGRQGLRFDQYEPDAFKKNVMGQFMKFLLETNAHTATSYTIDELGSSEAGDSGHDGDSAGDKSMVDAGDENKEGEIVNEEGDEEERRGRRNKNDKRKGKGKKRARSATPEETPSPDFSPASSPVRTPSPPPVSAHGWRDYEHTPVLPSTHVASKGLLQELAAMEATERRSQLGWLASRSLFDFTRENNKAWNSWLLKGLHGDDEGVFDDLRPKVTLEKGPPTKKKRVVVPDAPRRKSSRIAGHDISPLLLPEGDTGSGSMGAGETEGDTSANTCAEQTPANATDAPATAQHAPTTDAHATTDAPATDTPTTAAPATAAPATNAPAMDVPAMDVPATDTPPTDAPATVVPKDAPTKDTPENGASSMPLEQNGGLQSTSANGAQRGRPRPGIEPLLPKRSHELSVEWRSRRTQTVTRTREEVRRIRRRRVLRRPG